MLYHRSFVFWPRDKLGIGNTEERQTFLLLNLYGTLHIRWKGICEKTVPLAFYNFHLSPALHDQLFVKIQGLDFVLFSFCLFQC